MSVTHMAVQCTYGGIYQSKRKKRASSRPRYMCYIRGKTPYPVVPTAEQIFHEDMKCAAQKRLLIHSTWAWKSPIIKIFFTQPFSDSSRLFRRGWRIEPVLGCVVDLKGRRLSLARLGCAPSRRVDAINLLHSARDIGLQSTHRWRQHTEFQPGHRCRAVGGLGRALGRRGIGDSVGEVDAIVGDRGVKIEGGCFGIGEVVLARDH